MDAQKDFGVPQRDFRDLACRTSQKLLQEIAAGRSFGDLREAGISCCVPATDNGPQLMRADRWRTLICAILGFGLAGCGGIAAFAGSKHLLVEAERALSVETAGMICFFVGIAFLFYGGLYGQRVGIRQMIRQRLGLMPPAYIHAELEDTRTVEKLKLSAEDIVIIIPHPQQRMLQLEGFHYRYIIRGEDLLRIWNPPGPKKRVQIDYRIGDAELSFVLIEKSMSAEFAGLVGRGGFRDRLATALGLPVGQLTTE